MDASLTAHLRTPAVLRIFEVVTVLVTIVALLHLVGAPVYDGG